MCDAAEPYLVGCRFCRTGTYVPLQVAPRQKQVFAACDFSIVYNGLTFQMLSLTMVQK